VEFKSEVKAWSSAGGSAYFFDWIPREGPNGGRIVIDGFWVHADIQVDNSAAAIAQGEDFARAFNRIIVEQVDGKKRWNLPGDSSRVASYGLEGPERYTETADVATSANNTAADTAIYVPMSKRHTHTPEDFALPVDLFKQLVVEYPGANVFDIGTTDISIDFINYYVIAECHEELDLVIHCEDEVAQTDMTSTTEGRIVTGGKLHDLFLHATGASGGASLANLTDVRIDELGIPPFLRVPDLEYIYRRKRNLGANLNSTMGGEVRSDPFVTDQACAVLLADGDTSFYEGPVLSSVRVVMTNTVSALRAIHRIVTPASAMVRNRTSAMYKVPPGAFRVKAASKTMREVEKWPKPLRPFLPLKAPLPNVMARGAA